MPIEKAWKDPKTGQEFKYDWGFDTEKKKMPHIAFRKDDDSIEVTDDMITLKEPSAITKVKEALDRHIMKEMEKAVMSTTERISYVCGRCKENTPCNPYCVDCHRGSKFKERPFDYVRADMEVTKRIMNSIFGANGQHPARVPAIKDVKFNPPATIVFWADNTKTVVKAQEGDAFDPEKGLAMAIIKKLCGNKGNYNNVFHKWTAKYEPDVITPVEDDAKWKIWFQRFDDKGKQISAGVTHYEYSRKSNATRRARALFDYKPNVKWIVSKTNPWTKEAKNEA